MADEAIDPDVVRAKLYDFVSDPMNRHNPELERARRLLGQFSKSQAAEAVKPQMQTQRQESDAVGDIAQAPMPSQNERISKDLERLIPGAINSAADTASIGAFGNILRAVKDINQSPLGTKVNEFLGEDPQHTAAAEALSGMEGYHRAHPNIAAATDAPSLFLGAPAATGRAVAAPIGRGLESAAGSKVLNEILNRAASHGGIVTPLTALALKNLAPVVARTVPQVADISTRMLPPIVQALLASRGGTP